MSILGKVIGVTYDCKRGTTEELFHGQTIVETTLEPKPAPIPHPPGCGCLDHRVPYDSRYVKLKACEEW